MSNASALYAQALAALPNEALLSRQLLTDAIAHTPYNPTLWYQRALVYETLAYPELAIGDVYRALLLVDEVREAEDGSEYGRGAVDTWRDLTKPDDVKDIQDTVELVGQDLRGTPNNIVPVIVQASQRRRSKFQANNSSNNSPKEEEKEEGEKESEGEEEETEEEEEEEEEINPLSDEEKILLNDLNLKCRQILCTSLLSIGCLLDASEQAVSSLKIYPDDQTLQDVATKSAAAIALQPTSSSHTLRTGYVARVIYPWNHHEPNRTSPETVLELNKLMHAASKGNLEVRVTTLPTLKLDIAETINTIHTTKWNAAMHEESVVQLGVYATKPLPKGTPIFNERSILTVNNRLFDSLCDCCNGPLPASIPDCFPCEDCEEVTFCSSVCQEEATEKYHPALCGRDIDWLFKSTHADLSITASEGEKTASTTSTTGALYTLLLLKCLAMSLTLGVHPLDLPEVKYLYGSAPPPPLPGMSPIMPFTFADNVVSIFHLLTRLEVDPFLTSLDTSHPKDADSDNEHQVGDILADGRKRGGGFDLPTTLLLSSKILGTASARHDPISGRPEVAALHTCYSLVNHDCSPSLSWECKSEMVFITIRDVEIGEEVRDSYTDVRLGWRERREWLMGSLGGGCQCGRCLREEEEDKRTE